jgi:hypothetical protein
MDTNFSHETGEEHFGGLGLDGNLILRLILNEETVPVWLLTLTIRASGEYYERGNELSGCISAGSQK